MDLQLGRLTTSQSEAVISLAFFSSLSASEKKDQRKPIYRPIIGIRLRESQTHWQESATSILMQKEQRICGKRKAYHKSVQEQSVESVPSGPWFFSFFAPLFFFSLLQSVEWTSPEDGSSLKLQKNGIWILISFTLSLLHSFLSLSPLVPLTSRIGEKKRIERKW